MDIQQFSQDGLVMALAMMGEARLSTVQLNKPYLAAIRGPVCKRRSRSDPGSAKRDPRLPIRI
jgi:hypothetical protein